MKSQYKLNKYDVDDIVYVVDEFRVIKSIIASVIITQDKQGTHVKYNAYSYQQKDAIKRKRREFIEAMLIDNLITAKQSALANWRTITQRIENDLNNLTEKDFEPIENENK